MKKTLKCLIGSAKDWIKADPFTDSAAIAYYAVFSLPGLLVILFSVMSFFYDSQVLENNIFESIRSLVGQPVVDSLRQSVEFVERERSAPLALAVGLVTLFLGATGLFVQLQRSLNKVFHVAERPSHFTPVFIRDRLVSFGMILAIGFVFLVSLMLTAAINIFGGWMQIHLADIFLYFFIAVDFVLSLFVVSVLFALIFRFLPDCRMRFKYALAGGFVTSFLFHIGEYLLNLYFDMAKPASAYGTASSVILLMLWAFYSAMILLFGAVFTKKQEQME